VPVVSAEGVRALLISRGVCDAADDEALLDAARSEQHKLAATLLSLWERDGRRLSSAQAQELAAHRERFGYYHRTWDAIGKVAPDAFTVKGAGIAAAYPSGVLRSAGDLDVVCASFEEIWAAATYLLEDGWDLEAFTVQRTRPGDTVPYHLVVELTRPEIAHVGEILSVGLTTAEIFTTTAQRPFELSRAPRSPLAANIVALVAERWEREFRSRDLLDLTLLAARLTAHDVAVLRDGLARTGLWPEWIELTAAVAQQGWTLDVDLPEAGGAARRERLRRTAAAARWCHPVRALGYAAQAGVDRDSGRIADLAADFVHERVGVHRVLGLGLPLFGVPLGAPRPTAATLELERAGRHLLAHSPVGTFLLAAGAARQEWLDDAVASGPSASAAAD
jgi:hypothetical protein